MVSFLLYRAMSSSSSSSSALLLLFVYLLLHTATSLSFSFPYFNSTTEQFIAFQKETFLNGAISLTKNAYNTDIGSSVGIAYYNEPIPLHDAATGEVADLTTHFSFIINAFNKTRVVLIVGLTVSTGLILAAASYLCDFLWRKKNLEEGDPVLEPLDKGVIKEIEKIIQYKFKNKMLLAQALTQSSFNNPLRKPGKSYERLEFIGDSVLGFLMAKELFSSYKDLSPGQLTLLKAANVDTERLARIAIKANLHHYLRHNASQLEWQIKEFMEGITQYPIHSNGLLDPPKVLANIVESVIGAIFEDSNSSSEIVWKIFKKLAGPLIGLKTLQKHPVSELQELCQKNKMNLSYEKDIWTKTMTVKVFVDGNLYGSGTYGHKKEIAQNRAAKAALEKLKMTLQKVQNDSCQSEAR